MSTLRSRSSAIIEGASGAVARVATRSRGRRRVGAATAIAMIDVAGCGRGRPRASQTENATNTGGATDRSCRSVTWSTKRDANALTSITVTARYATAAATSARARTSVSLRWRACQVRTPSAASGTAIVSSASEPMCHAIERATSPTEYEPASPSGAYAPRSSPTPPSAMREPIHASASAPRAASVGHILRNGVVERSKTARRPSATRMTATNPTAWSRVANASPIAPSRSACRPSVGSRRQDASAQTASTATG